MAFVSHLFTRDIPLSYILTNIGSSGTEPNPIPLGQARSLHVTTTSHSITFQTLTCNPYTNRYNSFVALKWEERKYLPIRFGMNRNTFSAILLADNFEKQAH